MYWTQLYIQLVEVLWSVIRPVVPTTAIFGCGQYYSVECDPESVEYFHSLTRRIPLLQSMIYCNGVVACTNDMTQTCNNQETASYLDKHHGLVKEPIYLNNFMVFVPQTNQKLSI